MLLSDYLKSPKKVFTKIRQKLVGNASKQSAVVPSSSTDLKFDVDETSPHSHQVAQAVRGDYPPALIIHGVMPRSGTVYTGEILRLHPDLKAYPNEIWEIPFLKFADNLIEFENNFLNAYPQNHGKIGRHDFLPLFGSAFMRYLYEYLPEGKRMLLKDPHVYHLNFFFALFPNEHLLLLLRDGRDVVNSTIKTWPDLTFETICQRWKHNTDTILKFVDHPEARVSQLFLARYENIVQDPAGFAQDVCTHFHLNPDKFPYEKIVDLPVRGSSDLKKEASVTWEPMPKDKSFKISRKWTHWSSQMKDSFKKIAGQTLIDAGYASDFDW
ncbi:MAG: sulfotransferase [Cyanobacteria bacterium J06635_10]